MTTARFSLPLLLTAALTCWSAVATAQSITQQIEVMGWSATGNEIISKVTLGAQGIDGNGDPVHWRYTVMEITSTRSGKVLHRYRAGSPEGPPQQAWQDALPQSEGQQRLGALGLLEATHGPVGPDGQRAVIAFSGTFPEPMKQMDPSCPGCNVCTTTLQLQLVDGTSQQIQRLQTHQRTGTPYPPDGAAPGTGCPRLTATVLWHPQGQRFAVIYTEQVEPGGGELQRLRVYDPQAEGNGWESFEPQPGAGADPRQALAETRQALKEMMVNAADPLDKALMMVRLGDASRRLGQLDDAQGYYATAAELDSKSAAPLIGQAMVALQRGDRGAAAKLIRKAEIADRRANLHIADFALYYLAAGDRARADKLLTKATADQGGMSLERQLDLGQQLMEIDPAAGMTYLDAALSNAPAPLPAQARALAVQMAEVAIRQGDLDTAAAQLVRLDKQGEDAMRLALQISAMRETDPDRLKVIIDRAGALLMENPGRCGVYHARGLALTRARRIQEAMAHLAAATACDPSLSDAMLDAADLYKEAGHADLARQSYARFLKVAPADTPAAIRAQARDSLERLNHQGVILLRQECAVVDGELRCKGVLQNTGAGPANNIEVELTTFSGGRRPSPIVRQGININQILPGATIDFQITIAMSAAVAEARLVVGTNADEKRLNTAVITSW